MIQGKASIFGNLPATMGTGMVRVQVSLPIPVPVIPIPAYLAGLSYPLLITRANELVSQKEGHGRM